MVVIWPFYVILILFRTLKVARRLPQEAKPAAVYSSDLKRAAKTAQMIPAACSVSNVCIMEQLELLLVCANFSHFIQRNGLLFVSGGD